MVVSYMKQADFRAKRSCVDKEDYRRETILSVA